MPRRVLIKFGSFRALPDDLRRDPSSGRRSPMTEAGNEYTCLRTSMEHWKVSRRFAISEDSPHDTRFLWGLQGRFISSVEGSQM